MPSYNSSYKFPWRQGNHFAILVDSPEFFPHMLAAIDAARKYLLLEMYLVASGSITDRFINALLAAAERNVQVFLLFDDYGTRELELHDREQLTHRNIQTIYYNPLPASTLRNLYRIIWQRINHSLYRNHRKLLLVDGKIAFAGGTGLTDEVDSPLTPEMRWRETMIEIRGPILEDWQQLFTESWNKYAEQALTLPPVTTGSLENGQQGRVAVNEVRRRTGIQRSLLKHTKTAKHRIWFATAYFIPSWNIRRRLKRAARSGIDVRLLLPGPVTDHPGARYASRRYYGKLLKSKIRIYEYTPRFFHAKTVLCDNWVTIGSCNHDRWNLQWNLEANQEIEDENMATITADMFADDFANSLEVSAGEWEQRSGYLRVLEWFWRRVELLSLKIRHRRRH